MSINLRNTIFKNTNAGYTNLKYDKTAFTSEKETNNDTKPTENKTSSFKKFSDTLTIIASALIIGIPLLTSLKKGKKDVLLKKAQDLEQNAKQLEQTLQDAANNNKKAPFIQKFGCFWDNLSKNHKEFTNNFIYGLGVIVVEPFIIFTSPFGHDKSSQKDKLSAIARLPITFLSGISFQYSIDKFFSDLIPKLSKEGFLGEKFKSFSNTFDNLPANNKTKLKAIKEITVFTLSLLTLPLGISLTNTIYGKLLKKIKFKDEKEKQNNKSENVETADIHSNQPNSNLKKQKIAFTGRNPIDIAKEITKNTGEIKNTVVKDFETSKGITKKFYEFISKPIKSVLDSDWFDKKTSKLGPEGTDSQIFQKLIMCGIIAKDLVRAFANATFNYNNEDIPYDQRLYLLLFHTSIAVPTILVDIIAGFGAIKYQDKILENMLKKFKLSEAAHQRTKSGLKFFVPVALATIVGKRIIAPAFATPISGILKKKILNKKEEGKNTNTKIHSEDKIQPIFLDLVKEDK